MNNYYMKLDLFAQICLYIAAFGISDILLARLCDGTSKCKLQYFLFIGFVGVLSYNR